MVGDSAVRCGAILRVVDRVEHVEPAIDIGWNRVEFDLVHESERSSGDATSPRKFEEVSLGGVCGVGARRVVRGEDQALVEVEFGGNHAGPPIDEIVLAGVFHPQNC